MNKQKIIDAIKFMDENKLAPLWGYGYTMKCPFHEEETPSFLIYKKDLNYLCFTCQAKGSLKHEQ